jgi:eukaryotic-like serine/threonine-protein kinase
VRPLPATTGPRWQVSNQGGSQPHWSSDGRELFYLDGALRMVAAEVRAATTFEAAELRPLFDARGFFRDGFHQSYEVLPGGKDFVLLRPHQAGQRAVGVTLVQAEHWLDDVRARAGR